MQTVRRHQHFKISIVSALLTLGTLPAAHAVAGVTATATGAFTVDTKPDSKLNVQDGVTLSRVGLSKHFTGDLQAVGKGQMLSSMSAKKDAGAYVALERVTGTLQGHSGSFVLQHSGVMDQGGQHLNITVVPGSGTGELVGLTGDFKIKLADGKHSYVFVYSLPK